MVSKALRFYRPTQSQTALVTGGTGMLGQETVRVLAENGWQVAFQYHSSEEKASCLAEDLRRKGLEVEAIRYSLGGSPDCDGFMAEVEKRVGPIQAFIHCCAPEFELSGFEDNWLDVFSNMAGLNVNAFLKIANRCLLEMRFRQDGVILGVLSESLMGDRIPQFSAYTSAKMALGSLLKDLSIYVGNTGVRVLGVLPGAFSVREVSTLQTSMPADVQSAIRSRWPVGIEPRRIANLFLKVLNERREYPNGDFVAINALDGERRVDPFGVLTGKSQESEGPPMNAADRQETVPAKASRGIDHEQERLGNIFRDVFKLDENESVQDARIGQGPWDSLRHLDLLMSVEHGLDVSFHDVEGNALVSFAQILEVVREKKRNA